MKSILLNVPDELKDLILVAAKDQDMSVSAFLRWLVRKYLKRAGFIVEK